MSQRFQKTLITLNGQRMLANSVDISQDVSISPSFKINNYISNDLVIDSPLNSSLNLQYFLTGRDYLKDFISTRADQKITGYVAGLSFNYGYLDSYNISISPNEPIVVNATIKIFDQVTGSITDSTPINYYNIKPLNGSDVVYNINNSSEVSLSNINNIRWSYQTNFDASYNYKDSGMSRLSPDNVSIGEKTIDVEILSDDLTMSLPLSGNNLSLDITCRNGLNTGIFETFSCSGLISRKSFSNSANETSNSAYSLKQFSINNIPTITSIDTSTYSTDRKIKIYTTQTDNGYLTSYGLPIVEKVFVGDSECSFEIGNNNSNHVITGTLPYDAINGTLSIQTTRGTINHPSGLTLNHPAIVISGFYPITGKQNDQITISGSNFYRISSVKFGSSNANFETLSTGSTHFIKAIVPANASVGNIIINSLLRNNSGVSSRAFFPLMRIDSLNPATGSFGDSITLSGLNFSGVTGAYFNGIKSPSINILANDRIVLTTPPTGSGYAGGLITIYGTGGMKVDSYNAYLPILSITGVRTNPVELTIDLNKFDSGYLYPYNGGYKVRIDSDVYGFSRYNNTDSITGLIGASSRYPKISIYRPDGITTYPNYTGVYTQIGPAPTITRINYENNWNTLGYNFTVNKYGVQNIKVEGANYRDFYSKPWFGMLRHNMNKSLYNPINNFSSYLSDTEATIEFAITGMTGYYDLIVQNFSGSGIFTGAFYAVSPEPISLKCVASQYPVVQLFDTSNKVIVSDARPAANAIDQYTFNPPTTENGKLVYPHILKSLTSLDKTFSMNVVEAGTLNSGAWWQLELKPEFQNRRFDIREMYISMHDVPSPVNFSYNGASYGSRSPIYTTFITVFNTSNTPSYGFEADFDLTFGNLTPKGLFIWSGISNPITGFKKLVIYLKSQSVGSRGIAVNGVELY